MEFAVEKSTGSQKCSQRTCGKPIAAGEAVFSSTSISFGERGSCLGYHPQCVESDQVSCVMEAWDKVKGWEKFPEALKDQVTTAFEDILKNKVKKSPTKRKSESKVESKAKKPAKSTKSKAEKGEKAEKPEPKKGGPKKALSAYLLYTIAERQNVLDQHGDIKASAVMQVLGAAWKTVDEETKKKYEQESLKDKERFNKQKKEFDETGAFTKTPEEIEADRVREEKAKAAKKKAADKAAEKKAEKAREAKEAKDKETGSKDGKEDAEASQEGEAQETEGQEEEAQEEVEQPEEEAAEEEEEVE